MNLKKNWKKTILERTENNILKWNGYALHMGDNRWPKQLLTWLPHTHTHKKKEDAKCSGKGKLRE